ncbi:uncharacterized protein B0I36DRAFT_430927 [Microdochium trichocladiopsis]|uniref:Uncharacterized protein n=1 Tax=Microdochium trichocladiopsis TaxID=1682393 RepID=A0A9P8Y648_9PEZI|nr:uncharacterized protein B0I36DRAFT_430927 [Microdochium trichocladiopsis]KAH7030628.1 hypothetical protein B0I36DRAFT_430927 [Microdochium trichocladiopsis]
MYATTLLRAAVLGCATFALMAHATAPEAFNGRLYSGIEIAVPSEVPVNVSGVVPIPSFRMDRPYPGDWSPESDPQQDRWHLVLAVKEQRPIPENPGGPYGVGIIVEIAPPLPGSEGALYSTSSNTNTNSSNSTSELVWDVDKNVTDTWRLFLAHFDIDELRTVEDRNNMTDGSCPESVLSAACQQELRQQVMARPESAWNVGVPGTQGYSPLIENARNCEGYTKGKYSQIPLNQNFSRKAGYGYTWSGDADLYDSPNSVNGGLAAGYKKLDIAGGAGLLVSVESLTDVNRPERVEGEFMLKSNGTRTTQATLSKDRTVYFVEREWDGGKVVISPVLIKQEAWLWPHQRLRLVYVQRL